MIEAHLPALQIVVPLIGAPLCVIVRRHTIAWVLTVIVCFICFVISTQLLGKTLESGTISYALGGWVAPWGIEYRVDAVNAFILLLVSLIGAVVIMYSPASVAKELPEVRGNLFYAAFLLCLTGLLGMAITGDAFNVFVFLEISSLSSYALISLGPDRRALAAAYRYLILGTIGATFFVIGLGLMYMMTGTLNMADLAERLKSVQETRTVLAAFAFLSVGLSLKLALFPMHAWLPNAYAHAPSLVTAFIAATATKVAVYVYLRFFFTVYGAEYTFDLMRLDRFIVPFALLGIFIASLVAVFQSNIKRLLAYSSVAQVGYMVLGIGFVSVTGLTGTLIHLFNHAVMKGALFLALGCIMYRCGSVELADMRGLGRRMPFTMAAFVLGGLSLIGVPLTVGFVSKWYLVLAALERGWWPVAALVLLASLIAVVYIWRVVEVAYFQKAANGNASTGEAPLSMLIPTWVLIGTTLYFGISASFTSGVARRGAEILMGVTP